MQCTLCTPSHLVLLSPREISVNLGRFCSFYVNKWSIYLVQMFATICRMWCADSVTICGIAVAAFHRQMEDDTSLLGMKRFNSQSTTEYSKENDRE
jgi:hypothetical protein